MTSVFHQLLQNEAFVDVTLACNDLSLKAHKVRKASWNQNLHNFFSQVEFYFHMNNSIDMFLADNN